MPAEGQLWPSGDDDDDDSDGDSDRMVMTVTLKIIEKQPCAGLLPTIRKYVTLCKTGIDDDIWNSDKQNDVNDRGWESCAK